MGCGHNLRKINYRDTFIFVNHDVEFVEVTMYDTSLGKADNDFHQLVNNFLMVLEILDFDHGHRIDERHHNCMSTVLNRSWHWKSFIVKGLHVRKLFDGCETCQGSPRCMCTMLEIVPLVGDLSKGYSTKSVQLQSYDLPIGCFTQ